MIRLLLAEDSVTQREILRRLIDASGELVVVAEARNGREAVELVSRFRPDVVLMDLHMPDLDGVAATREIMRNTPVPIVIASASLKRQEVDLGMEALQAGAVSVIEKPQGAVLLHLDKIGPLLRAELIGASRARVTPLPLRRTASSTHRSTPRFPGRIEIIGLCASTGGPPVLQQILSGLPRPFPVPVLIVQHIAPGFMEGFAKWLAKLSGQRVEQAQHRQPVGEGFWLPDGKRHLEVDSQGRFNLVAGRPDEIHCPSGNPLFRSLAEHYGPRALGVLLTGMGDDGADGLRQLRDAGGTTIVQDEESSLIFGMPRMAIERGAAQLQLSPASIVQAISESLI